MVLWREKIHAERKKMLSSVLPVSAIRKKKQESIFIFEDVMILHNENNIDRFGIQTYVSFGIDLLTVANMHLLDTAGQTQASEFIRVIVLCEIGNLL